MGMYTGLRFKGYVKPEYRDRFIPVAEWGEWEEVPELGFDCARNHFIPCGALSYMPDSWGQVFYFDKESNKHCSTPDTDGFERSYNPETGYWTFQCSLKNYQREIEQFFEILPQFIEKIEHCEYFYESWNWSERYDLIDGKIKRVEEKFIKYYDWRDEEE